MGTRKSPDKQDLRNSLSESGDKRLMLHNDDVHTFDYVIDSLIEVCNYTMEQAEQITYIVHYKGECEVKKGDYELLKPFRDGLFGRELKVTIE